MPGLKFTSKMNRARLNSLRIIIRKQKLKLIRLQGEVDYLLSPIHLLKIVDGIQGHYSILLDPPEVIVKGSDQGMSEEYKIKATDIICIISSLEKSKVKEIYLKREFKNRKGDPKRTQIIKINKEKTIPVISKEIESAQVYLATVSQSAAVNIDLYDLEGDFVVLKKSNRFNKDVRKIKITKRYVAEFHQKKEALERIRIFHKTDFSSILNI